MKNLFIFLILSMSSFMIANCNIFKNLLEFDKNIRLNYDRNPEKGWNNFGIDAGFTSYDIYKKTAEIPDSTIYLYYYTFQTYGIKYYDFFHFGLSLKTKSNNKFEPLFTCKFLDLNWIENLDFSKDNHSIYLKALNVNSDIFFDKYIEWAQLGFGRGYGFLNKIDRNIIISIFAKIGYTSYEPDVRIIDELSEYSSLAFTNYEYKLGGNLYIFFNPVILDVSADYSKIIEENGLGILSVISKLCIINQEIIQNIPENETMVMSTKNLLKKYDAYFSCSYRKFYILGHTQDAFNFSLGFEYYFSR